MRDSTKTEIKPFQNRLFDRYKRQLNYLRISITDRCNLNCTYCVPKSQPPKLPHNEILRYEEILRLARIFLDLGISKIRITGGEPLVRKGVFPFLSRLNQMKEIEDLALTTNGLFLTESLEQLKSAGIKRLNISLDTLNPETFYKITGENVFHKVWEGVVKSEQIGFHPIKINVVALRGINDEDLIDLAKLSFSHPFHIRFIEQMPMGNQLADGRNPLLTPEIKNLLTPLGKLIPIQKKNIDGPAQRYKFKDAKGEIGFISPLSHHFCSNCNRLRLTASGFLRVCLLAEHQTDLKTPLRSGFSDRKIAEIILEAIRLKPMSHNLNGKQPVTVPCQMSSIGG
ncbi:MAG: GTP 3',8-cyclase MoaA [Deltaproteobacteria bacterium]|nr:GTP 3',8-cyclase MoaA [Deltaproteobacteria bacterium]